MSFLVYRVNLFTYAVDFKFRRFKPGVVMVFLSPMMVAAFLGPPQAELKPETLD